LGCGVVREEERRHLGLLCVGIVEKLCRMAENLAPPLAGGALSMELVHKGYDGPPVSIPKLGLGVYQVPPREALQATTQALKFGYRHIDSAALYRNEQAVGQSLSQLLFLEFGCYQPPLFHT
jgi:hypothetical protein